MFQTVLASGQALTLTSGNWDLPEDDDVVKGLVEKGILEPLGEKKAPEKPAEPAPKVEAKAPPIVAEVPKTAAPKVEAKEPKAPKAPKPPKAPKAPKVQEPAQTPPPAPEKPAEPATSDKGGEEGGEWVEGEGDESETNPPKE